MATEDPTDARGVMDAFGPPRGSYRILRVFADHLDHAEALADLKQRLYAALGDFPALAGETITVGRLHEDADLGGRAYSHNRIIELPTDEYTTNVTLYHELGHVAIRVRNERGEDHPKTSEEYCSIFAMARMPAGHVDEERIPYLGEPELDPRRFPTVCQHALDYREEHHDYIQQCKEWLRI